MERYKKFVQLREQGILRYKDRLEIIIYGSYKPSKEKKRLIAFRDCLRKDGFVKTNIVEDYPDSIIPSVRKIKPEELFLEKSYSCLEFADVNFFVFTQQGKGNGRSVELTYLCYNLIDRVIRTTIFDEEKNGVTVLSTLPLGLVSRFRIDRVPFESDVELCELGKGKAFEYLVRFSHELRYR